MELRDVDNRLLMRLPIEGTVNCAECDGETPILYSRGLEDELFVCAACAGVKFS